MTDGPSLWGLAMKKWRNRSFLTFYSPERYEITRIEFLDSAGNIMITVCSYEELLVQLTRIKVWRRLYSSYDSYRHMGEEENRVCVAFGDKPLTSKIRIVCGSRADTLDHVADDISFRPFYEEEKHSLNCSAGELGIGLGYKHVERNKEIVRENVFIFESYRDILATFIPTQFELGKILPDKYEDEMSVEKDM